MGSRTRRARRGGGETRIGNRDIGPERRTPRFLPRARWKRWLVYLALILGYATVLWFWVFPWVDRTFVNRPAI